MSQLSLFQPPSWTVSDLTRYMRSLIEGDVQLQELWVSGEVSNFSRPSSGHWYFTLKDSSSALRVVMWRNAAARQAFIPREGDAVEVHGAVGIYESTGVYQLYADRIRSTGEGALFQEFQRLKERLEAEGLFAPERKRPIPQFPRRIGIVTSPTGAALRDMINTLRRRYPLAEVVLSPTPVQGSEAPDGICDAIQRLCQHACPDVILVARGGGSIEDLWAFNEEVVARAIAAAVVPVISGVGHETDFTIADFVSDLRAPTPTAAAELATPNKIEDLRSNLEDLVDGLVRSTRAALEMPRWELSEAQRKLQLQSPLARLRSDRQRLDELSRRADTGLERLFERRRLQLSSLQQRMEALNPEAVLRRGFAIVSRDGGQPVRNVSQVKPGEALNVRVGDGSFGVRVNSDTEKKDG